MMTPAAGEVISQIVIASFVVCIKGLEQKRLNYGAGCIALHGPASIMSPAPESESGEQQQRSVKYQLHSALLKGQNSKQYFLNLIIF